MAKNEGLETQKAESGRELQAPQAPEDRHGPKYDNDTKGWLRGVGQKPGFDRHKAGR